VSKAKSLVAVQGIFKNTVTKGACPSDTYVTCKFSALMGLNRGGLGSVAHWHEYLIKFGVLVCTAIAVTKLIVSELRGL